MDVGKRIAQLREARGWTTNRLANMCGLSQSFLRAVELGEKGISVENLQVVCDALQISLQQFFAVPEGDIRQEDRLLMQTGKLTHGQRKALTDFLEALSHQD